MLLSGYRKEIFRSKCRHEAEGVHCFAHLNDDIAEVIPYLNAEMGGDAYIADPPSVTFKAHGKLITIHAKKIAVNALSDEAEAEKICDWLMREINDIWERRNEIEPKHEARSQPKIFDILKLLPNIVGCPKECGQPTCMVFAKLLSEGVKVPGDCPHLEPAKKEKLEAYLSGFNLG